MRPEFVRATNAGSHAARPEVGPYLAT